MHIVTSCIALIGHWTLGLLALGAMSQPLPQDQSVHEWGFEFDEPTLTQDLNTWAAGQPLVETAVGTASLRDLTVDLRDQQLVLRGTVNAAWLTAPVDLAASASMESGRLLVQVHDAHVNGFDLPQHVRWQLERQLQDQVDRSLWEYKVVVRSVRVGDGRLVLRGSRQ
jgi:hypothetical protein